MIAYQLRVGFIVDVPLSLAFFSHDYMMIFFADRILHHLMERIRVIIVIVVIIGREGREGKGEGNLHAWTVIGIVAGQAEGGLLGWGRESIRDDWLKLMLLLGEAKRMEYQRGRRRRCYPRRNSIHLTDSRQPSLRIEGDKSMEVHKNFLLKELFRLKRTSPLHDELHYSCPHSASGR